MDQSGIQIVDVRKLLHEVLEDWRTAEMRAIRTRLLDFEDKLERIERMDAEGHISPLKEQIQQQFDAFKGRLDKKYAMIEEAYKAMAEYVDRRESVTE